MMTISIACPFIGRMTKKEKEVSRHYRLVHQILSLTGINFQTKSIIG